jgi:hypothetical protein
VNTWWLVWASGSTVVVTTEFVWGYEWCEYLPETYSVNHLYAIPVKTVMDEIRQSGYHDVLIMATYWHAAIVAGSTFRSHASILKVHVC